MAMLTVGSLLEAAAAAPRARLGPTEGVVEPAAPLTPLPAAEEPRLVYTGRGRIPFTRHEVTSTASYPYSTAGRVFAQFDSPRSDQLDDRSTVFGCSGTVVESANKSLVITAAHCLRDEGPNGQLASRVEFVPGYSHGREPFGRWTASRIAVMAGWTDNEENRQVQYDIGAIVVQPDAEGRRLAEVVGSRGVKWNAPPDQAFESFSYPGAPPFDGETMYSCRSNFGGRDEATTRDGFLLSMGCDTGEGGSGGGWIIGGAYLNSVTSYSLASDPEVNYGPYFGSDFFDLYQRVRGVSTMDISLLLIPVRAGYLASGRVTTDGFVGCRSGATVQLRRKTASGWKVLKSTTTAADGRYRMVVPSLSGAYATRVVARDLSPVDRCLQAISERWA